MIAFSVPQTRPPAFYPSFLNFCICSCTHHAMKQVCSFGLEHRECMHGKRGWNGNHPHMTFNIKELCASAAFASSEDHLGVVSCGNGENMLPACHKHIRGFICKV